MLRRLTKLASALAALLAVAAIAPVAASAGVGTPTPPPLPAVGTPALPAVGAPGAPALPPLPAVNGAVRGVVPVKPHGAGTAPTLPSHTLIFRWQAFKVVYRHGRRTYVMVHRTHHVGLRVLMAQTTNCVPQPGFIHCVLIPLDCTSPAAGMNCVAGCPPPTVITIDPGSFWQLMAGVTVDPTTGTITSSEHTNYQGATGTGDDGVKFQMQQVTKDDSQFTPFNPSTGTSFTVDEALNDVLISQGPDQNEIVHTDDVMTISVDTSGTVTLVDSVSGPGLKCTG